MTANKLWSTS